MKGTQTLEYKQSLLRGLLTSIEMLMGVPRDPITVQKVEALQNGLTFRLKELVEKAKHEEIDLKLAVFKEVKDVLNSA